MRQQIVQLCKSNADLISVLEKLGAAIEEGDLESVLVQWALHCKPVLHRAKQGYIEDEETCTSIETQ